MPYQELSTATEFASLVDAHDTFLFDCDGVLWSGDDAIAGAQSVLEKLRKRGKQVIFVTNNASKSRRAYLEKFKKMGIDAKVVSSSSAGSLGRC